MSAQDFSIQRDQQRIPVWFGLSSVDGVTPVPIAVDGVSLRPKFDIGTSVSAVIANLPQTLPRDGNRIPCLGGISTADGITIIPLSVNPSTGAILAQTT